MNGLGHYYTLSAYAKRALRAPVAAVAQPFSVDVADARLDSVRLTGYLSQAPEPETRELLIVVHGLGGNADSAYMRPVTQLAEERGIACLRLNLRGADLLGEDMYHAGLTSDLQAVLQAPELQRYTRVAVLGYSLGGHLCLRWATQAPDPRVRAVAAICSPLFLAESSKHFDTGVAHVYRRHVLRGLKDAYLAFHKKHPLPGLPSPAEAQAIRWICDFDQHVVAPRHGFADAAAYYAAASVGPHLGDISLPSLLIAADRDPMVDPVAQQRWVARNANSLLKFRMVRGGHLGFAACDIGEAAAPNLDAQVLTWLLRHTCSDA